MSIEKILIVDDDRLVRNFIVEALSAKNIEVYTAENGTKALAMVKEMSFDLVITDMKMTDLTGLELLCKVKEISPNTLVVVITGFGSIENAVEAMKMGAFHYLIKPFSLETIETVIDKARNHFAAATESPSMWQQPKSSPSANSVNIIGESPAIKKIIADMPRIAKSNANIFISGESGTGKEVIAHAIHYNSLRAHKPFIKVNCAAIPDTLVESEFFGHEKGAFTGANAKRIGRFELANGGSLLLDEVTEIPLMLQAKLLRAVQEHEFERVGGSKPVKVDVRLISTSNRDMKEAIDQKKMREDLYYRLNVVPIYLPPLRERKEDILPLAVYFLEKICKENHADNTKQFSPEAKAKLLHYSWPGNVRELANIIERAVVMDQGNTIAPEHLYIDSIESQVAPSSASQQLSLTVGTSLRELEKLLIIETLHSQQNNRTRTAEILGISLKTLRNKLQEYQLD